MDARNEYMKVLGCKLKYFRVFPEACMGVPRVIQEIFGNFNTLYQLRMCVMTSWDLNVYVRRKNFKLCPH